MAQHIENPAPRYMTHAPADFDPHRDLPQGFLDFLLPLHKQFAPWQQKLVAKRAEVLQSSHRGHPPNYSAASEATTSDWRIELPDWCADQRNQMTGPADDAELCVKLLNSGSPAVMVDLEDSMANEFSRTLIGIDNTIAMYYGDLTYVDHKRGGNVVSIKPSNVVLWTRVRGLHLAQAGVEDELT